MTEMSLEMQLVQENDEAQRAEIDDLAETVK